MDNADVAFILKFIISVTLCLKRNGGQCPHRRPWPGRKIREIILNQLLFSPLNRNFLLVTLTGNHCYAPEFLECTLVCPTRPCTMGLHQGVTGVICQGKKFPVSSRFYKAGVRIFWWVGKKGWFSTISKLVFLFDKGWWIYTLLEFEHQLEPRFLHYFGVLINSNDI